MGNEGKIVINCWGKGEGGGEKVRLKIIVKAE
jgi:hypothetical protein